MTGTELRNRPAGGSFHPAVEALQETWWEKRHNFFLKLMPSITVANVQQFRVVLPDFTLMPSSNTFSPVLYPLGKENLRHGVSVSSADKLD
jgi:hypothetical protein